MHPRVNYKPCYENSTFSNQGILDIPFPAYLMDHIDSCKILQNFHYRELCKMTSSEHFFLSRGVFKSGITFASVLILVVKIIVYFKSKDKKNLITKQFPTFESELELQLSL